MVFLGWLFRNRLIEKSWYLKMMLYSIPLPYLANELGWVVAEVGRQPWIVYGIMTTASAVSPVDGLQVLISFAAFVLVYTLLGATAFYLMAKHAFALPQKVAEPSGRLLFPEPVAVQEVQS